MKTIKFTSIGDCCVDLYPQFNQAFLGGSAFNVALTAQRLNIKTSLISAVGTDKFGKKYLSAPINTQFLASFPAKTSQVKINLDQHHSPVFSRWQLGALKKLELTSIHQKFLTTQNIAYCTAIKPLEKILSQFCQMDLPEVFKSADFDGNTPYSFSVQDIPQYLSGLNLVVKSIDASDTKSLTFLKNLSVKYNKICLVTLGSRGSQVFTKEKTYFQPAIKTKPTDTTGAGDAYLATFIIKYLQTKDIQQSMFLATQAAAQKITRLGASS
ncbi:MAG: carbohydrate kinase family protein [Patescibacteria group bacterium]|nr:carbohydrate kinase family protein [Patescibacteria group bacterium]